MCGLTGIVTINKNNQSQKKIDFSSIKKLAASEGYLKVYEKIRDLKNDELFNQIFLNPDFKDELQNITTYLQELLEAEEKKLSENIGFIETSDLDLMLENIEILRDIKWCLKVELTGNIEKIKNLMQIDGDLPSIISLLVFKKINTVLNSIERLEVRGRDSAGISLLFILKKDVFENFKNDLSQKNKTKELEDRTGKDVLLNKDISISSNNDNIAIAFTYKIAAEIGKLGDNTEFLRKQIKNDDILHLISKFAHEYYTVSSHTRWASIGIITEANCHPVDNKVISASSKGIIHVCLNGDIDNYLSLKEELEKEGYTSHNEITTDTKIIPLQIGKYINKGFDIKEAFRLSVNDFEGSHAISMHTDLAPGQFFLAQKGSGQAIFIGLSKDHYMPTSEIYGFIEETPYYIKMNGEKPNASNVKGQIFVLKKDSKGGLDGIEAIYYDGSPIELTRDDIKNTIITSRDIDRQNFPHYFLKEISESPNSIEKTLLNRWKINKETGKLEVILNEKVVNKQLKSLLTERKIRRIFFIGQGTAGVAAIICSDIINYYLNDPTLQIKALKSSELSGFQIDEKKNKMSDTLIIAITQSGTTTDTNRAVDMAKEKGAYTIAIVNRRDSDITFKVDGVMYTSSGRDIEMSVASTKAFYAQIIAGAVLGLYIARIKKCIDEEFENQELKRLLEIPISMRKVLSLCPEIEKSAKQSALCKIYWAVVGSGPNKASADEIRIKLSELCYKTISSDYVEDKKHIDLSSEPLIIICAAGVRETVISDIIKDTAIFKAHKALPIVITDEGEERFNTYSKDIFHVPKTSEHLVPILNTLVGHIWGYYAALSINESSMFFYLFREDIQKSIDEYIKNNNELYEIVLESSFREKIALFYYEFRKKKAQNCLPAIMGVENVSDLTLLLKYLSGRLSTTDFELDFGVKGTSLNMITKLLDCLSESINCMARPIDAIKHQAKTVTVGTSRVSEKIEGIIFNKIYSYNFKLSQLTPNNLSVLKNLQKVIEEVRGSILYKISGLNILGELIEKTTIHIVNKDGILINIPSRVESDNSLKGTKRIIVKQGNVYIGKGRSDGRSILIVPITSESKDMLNIIEYLLLFNLLFKDKIDIDSKIKALGGKYEHIKNIVQENSIIWKDDYLELIETDELFGRSAEKIGEYIIKCWQQKK